jgi:hypothetical protein
VQQRHIRIRPGSLAIQVESRQQYLDGETQIMDIPIPGLAIELTQAMMDCEELCWERLIAMTRSEVS